MDNHVLCIPRLSEIVSCRLPHLNWTTKSGFDNPEFQAFVGDAPKAGVKFSVKQREFYCWKRRLLDKAEKLTRKEKREVLALSGMLPPLDFALVRLSNYNFLSRRMCFLFYFNKERFKGLLKRIFFTKFPGMKNMNQKQSFAILDLVAETWRRNSKQTLFSNVFFQVGEERERHFFDPFFLLSFLAGPLSLQHFICWDSKLKQRNNGIEATEAYLL